MFLSTTETIPGIDNSKVRYVGFVYGGSVQARNGFKNMVGVTLNAYEELIESTTQTAMQKMMNMAQQMGANGIVGIKVNTNSYRRWCCRVLFNWYSCRSRTIN